VTAEQVIEANRHQLWLVPSAIRIAKRNGKREAGVLVGRHEELVRLRKLFDDPKVRIVSIVGAGGMGKTALMKQFLATTETDPVAFVEISEAPNEQRLAMALARALGLGAGVGMKDTLRVISALGPRLFVLDAIEFYSDDPIRIVEQIVATGSKVFLTGRRPVGAQNEYLLRLGPLDGAPAITLLHRNLESNHEPLGEEDVEALCSKLGRIPLAIEWAASSISMQGLDATRGALEVEGGGLPWQSALAWTFRQLSDEARRLWLYLALCPCPLTREVVELLVERERLGEGLPELVRYGVVKIERRYDDAFVRMLDTLSELVLALTHPSEMVAAQATLGRLWREWTARIGRLLRGKGPEASLQQTAAMLPAITDALKDAAVGTWIDTFLDLFPFFYVFGMPEEIAEIASRQRAEGAGSPLAFQSRLSATGSPERLRCRAAKPLVGRRALSTRYRSGSGSTGRHYRGIPTRLAGHSAGKVSNTGVVMFRRARLRAS
jgi:hypothetical protein